MYQHIFQKHGDTGRNEAFIKMFQFVNINTYTEAYCKSVGSLMNILVGERAESHLSQLLKRITIELQCITAALLHILSKSIIPDIAKTLRNSDEFLRKLEQLKDYMLKYKNLSVSLGNLQRQETERAHLPVFF